jgi:replicative DNA helicase
MIDGAEAVRERGIEAVDEVVGRLMQLHNGRGVRERLLQDAVVDAINKLERIQKQGESRGLSTGLGLLDDKLGGLQDGELYVIGARPSMGKTAMMLCAAIRAGASVGIFSGEQPAIQLGQRAISAIGRVDSRAIRRAEMSENDWKRAVDTMTTLASQAPVVIDDTPSPTADYVLRRARQWQRKYGIKAVFVDYIQRMTGNNRREGRQSQIEEIARTLKTVAGELSIPVVALAQLNRELERRPDKRPHLSDLRDSGAIEAEADTVCLLYRDEVYNEDTPEPGVCEIHVAKQRNGPTGKIKVAWLKELMVFENLY